MAVTYRTIEWNDTDGLQIIADLHLELLNFGPFAQLGRDFIRDIAYKVNMKEGLMTTELCEFNGSPVGFVAYVSDSINFHRKSVAKYFPTISVALFRSILQEPSRFFKLFRIAKLMIARKSEVPEDDCQLGEVICVAAKPEFLTHEFIKKYKHKISKTLIEHAVNNLKQKDVSKVRMIVDEDNKAPLFLYHSMGARIEKLTQGGEKKLVAIFDLDPISH